MAEVDAGGIEGLQARRRRDVAAALHFARDAGREVSVRGGGDSYSGMKGTLVVG